MVVCIIAAVVFGFMSLFSAHYRGYAREAFHCVFRMATLRKCNTSFDKKMRAAVVARLMRRAPRAAGFVHRHFEALSWVFAVVLFSSLGYTAYAAYNLFVWQNCEGPGGSCVLVPVDTKPQCVVGDVPVTAPSYFDANASVMFFYRDGCGWCDKEKQVLSGLAPEGYRVRPVHLDTHPEYWNQYGIKLTPTFIGPDGGRLDGYYDAAAVRTFLDKYK